jgi:hypothetical protein
VTVRRRTALFLIALALLGPTTAADLLAKPDGIFVPSSDLAQVVR